MAFEWLQFLSTILSIATMDLPSEIIPLGARPAGLYLYQDQQYRIVVGTPLRTVWVVSHTSTAFNKDAEYDLNKNPATDIGIPSNDRSEEHTSELQSPLNLV